jgi:hypothetical protein
LFANIFGILLGGVPGIIANAAVAGASKRPGAQQGAVVKESGVAEVHKGETIVPAQIVRQHNEEYSEAINNERNIDNNNYNNKTVNNERNIANNDYDNRISNIERNVANNKTVNDERNVANNKTVNDEKKFSLSKIINNERNIVNNKTVNDERNVVNNNYDNRVSNDEKSIANNKTVNDERNVANNKTVNDERNVANNKTVNNEKKFSLSKIINETINNSLTKFPGAQYGAIIKKSGVIGVHKDEVIVPANIIRKHSDEYSKTINNNKSVDNSTIEMPLVFNNPSVDDKRYWEKVVEEFLLPAIERVKERQA